MTRQPWFASYEAAPGRPTGTHVGQGGMTLIDDPDDPDDADQLVPAMPSLLGWIVSLITAR
ncbi:hypothetical protein [Nocardia thailandica]|uniref:hypothetical protein n=1 Tax=Nocardia thailandica TaxID=257275 RepID=UPI0002D57D62|nr:hypothetical protein [Nocardia thailandica]